MNKVEFKDKVKSYIGTDYYKITNYFYEQYKDKGYLSDNIDNETIYSIAEKIRNKKYFGRKSEFRSNGEIMLECRECIKFFVEYFNENNKEQRK